MTNLGRGLASLIPPKQKATEVEYPKLSEPLRDRKESVFDIEVGRVKDNPYQPRHEMDAESLKDLAASVKQHGILQPVIVTKVIRDTDRGQQVEYQLVAGHRRLAAAKLAGLPTIPAIVRDSTDQQKLELALVENIQRSDLNALERAKGFKQLQEEFDLTHEEIGKKVGKSREYVSNSMRLLNLPEEVQRSLGQGKITEGHARTIAGIKNPAAQKALFDEIFTNNLSVRQIEQRAREVFVQGHKRKVAFDPEIKKIAQRLELFLGKKVQVKKSGLGGRIFVEFEDKKDLESLASKILE
ncbi:MAG: ParB/RepB/Spo0J family partition protein [Candidatus Portnoybacteria bacterium]|nr:ParB/RepB/Spo0J family partition protein [Candidatus Portnoybacteria bacterium]MDD4982624.1 ParB/RepB/Spo0J family partition protein [Candidatus Portnoybacteria bacterium]